MNHACLWQKIGTAITSYTILTTWSTEMENRDTEFNDGVLRSTLIQMERVNSYEYFGAMANTDGEVDQEILN